MQAGDPFPFSKDQQEMWAQANAGTSGYPTKQPAGLEPGPHIASVLAYALGLSMKFSYMYQCQIEFASFIEMACF